MKTEDIKRYKERLVALRRRLRGESNQMVESVLDRPPSESRGDLSRMPIHMADIGSDNYDREFTLTLLKSQDRTLEQVEEALERIEEGKYGKCTTCGATIPKSRLNAIPYAVQCVKCASEQPFD